MSGGGGGEDAAAAVPTEELEQLQVTEEVGRSEEERVRECFK
jgi:hypothetical protein